MWEDTPPAMAAQPPMSIESHAAFPKKAKTANDAVALVRQNDRAGIAENHIAFVIPASQMY